VVGIGRIGSNVARKAIGLGMRVIAFDPYLDPEKAKGHEFEIVTLKDIIARADFITVHTPSRTRPRACSAPRSSPP
jgi:D-3-phosphoglycerate dehydrogenase